MASQPLNDDIFTQENIFMNDLEFRPTLLDLRLFHTNCYVNIKTNTQRIMEHLTPNHGVLEE